MFNLFELPENDESLKIFSIWERRKSREKFGGTKACKAGKVRKYFVNPKIEIEVFSSCVNYIISSLYFKHISRTFFLLHIRTMNDECYHSVVHIGSPALVSFYCVCFVSFYFLLGSYFFVSSITCWGMEVSLAILKIKQSNSF